MTELAKLRCYYGLSCKSHDTNMNSQVAWECIDILKAGEKDHHNMSRNMNTEKEDGTISENDKENMRAMHPHFQKLFNNHQPTEFRVPKIIKQ